MAEGILRSPMRSTGLLVDMTPQKQQARRQEMYDTLLALPKAAYESFTIPSRAIRGEFGVPSPDNQAFVDAATQFSLDFGALPTLAIGPFAKQAPNVIRMGMGGADTASGGTRRPPEVMRDVDELGFYSQALEAAKSLSQAKGTGQQYRAMLLKAGVKPDEIAFTPELEGLLSQPKVTKRELVGLLEDNRIRPKETVYYGGDTSGFEGLNFSRQGEVLDPEQAYGPYYISEERELLLMNFGDDVADIFEMNTPAASAEDIKKVRQALDEGNLDLLAVKDSELFVDNDQIVNVIESVEDAAEELARNRYYDDPVIRYRDPDTGYEIIGSDDMEYSVRREDGEIIPNAYGNFNEAQIIAETDALDRGIIGMGGGDTRFMEYTEDGGTNYREIMLQVPEYAGKTDEFVYSSHFDEPDIVVHARTKDRTFGSDEGDLGEALYVEELQSDFAQQGRRQGFRGDFSEDEIAKINSDAQKAKTDYINASDDYFDAYHSFGEKLAAEVNKTSPAEVFYDKASGVVKYVETPFSPNSMTPQDRVVFGDNQIRWMLQTGEPMAYRNVRTFELTPIEALDLNRIRPKNIKELTDKRESAFDIHEEISEKFRKATLGMTPAPFVKSSEKFAEVGIKRLLDQAVKEDKNAIVFSSGDVQYDRWGEDGLVKFYDEIIPKVGKKVAKKLDPDAPAKKFFLEDQGGDVSGERFFIEITPKMREEIIKGQQLFTAPNVLIPTSGLLSKEEQYDEFDKKAAESGLLTM